MKEIMLSMMLPMFPYMKSGFMWSAGLTAIGFIFLVVNLVSGSDAIRSMARTGGLVGVVSGLFFLACQAAGMYLATPPMINFGDSSKYEFINVDFWKLGLGLLIVGLIIRKFAPASTRG